MYFLMVKILMVSKEEAVNLIDGTVVDAHEFCSTMRDLKMKARLLKLKKLLILLAKL